MSNVSSASDNNYYLNASGPDGKISNNITIYAGQTITIKILNLDEDEFEGAIRFYDDSGYIESNKTKEQKQKLSISEPIESIKIVTGMSDEKYSLERSFEDKYVDQMIIIKGQVNGTYPTKNNVTINILTNYCTIKFGDNKLTIRKDNSKKDKLEANFIKYLTSTKELKGKIETFDINGDVKGFESIENISQSYKEINELLAEESIINEAKNNEIENIISELDSTHADLLNGLNDIATNIKVQKVYTIQQNVTELKNDYRGAKSDLRSSTFYPAGLLFFIGIFGGILNVQRWKKNEIYLKMYSKKAKVANPVNISIIISVILLIIMIVVLSVYGDLKIFAYLI